MSERRSASDPSPRTPWAQGSPWRAVAVAAAVALGAVGAIAAGRIGVPLEVGAIAGAVAGFLGVLALPSLPTRRVVIVLLGLAGLAAVRHASYSGPDTTVLLLLWSGATLVALVLSDRAAAEEVAPLAHGAPLASRTGETVRIAIAIAVVVAVAAVGLAPTLSDHLARHVWPGADPSGTDFANAPSSLRESDRLDMSQRPRLSSQVVFTVDAPRPAFWRGETFDEWDGHTGWTRSDPGSTALPRDGVTTAIPVDPYDAGAQTGPAMRQTFHMQSDFSDVIFAAPSPVSVETDKTLGGRPDGTAIVYGGFGKGSVYTVTSRSALPTERALRAADKRAVPAPVLDQFAQTPDTTTRVRALALQITERAPTTYDKITAIEAWLAAHVRYSVDAPLTPAGKDIVDDFLFHTRVGWCEQIASSLVVMARAVGIPARLATGFVSGSRDALTGEFVVRELDAHAWAEIYFPGIGWQPFDPTASVPLAGNASSGGSLIQDARHHAFELGIIAVVLLLAAVSTPELLARSRRRRARRTASWGTRSLVRLERIGRRAGRVRAPAETPREYARALAEHLGDDRVRAVGDALDADGFSRAGASPSARHDAEAVLSSLGP